MHDDTTNSVKHKHEYLRWTIKIGKVDRTKHVPGLQIYVAEIKRSHMITPYELVSQPTHLIHLICVLSLDMF